MDKRLWELCFLPIIIYKVLKPKEQINVNRRGFLPIIIYKVLKPYNQLFFDSPSFLPIIIYKVLKLML